MAHGGARRPNYTRIPRYGNGDPMAGYGGYGGIDQMSGSFAQQGELDLSQFPDSFVPASEIDDKPWWQKLGGAVIDTAVGGGGRDPGPGITPGSGPTGPPQTSFPNDPSQIPGHMEDPQQHDPTGIIDRLKGAGSDVVDWAGSNPEIAASIIGGGVEVWGAHKRGQAADRQFKQEREEWERDQEREDERERNRAATYQRILDRRRAY